MTSSILPLDAIPYSVRHSRGWPSMLDELNMPNVRLPLSGHRPEIVHQRVWATVLLFMLTVFVWAEEFPSLISADRQASLDRMTSVFRDGKVDIDLCLDVMNRQRRSKRISDVEDARLRNIFLSAAGSLSSERIIECLNAMEDPGPVGDPRWRDLVRDRCASDEREQLRWSRFVVSSKEARTRHVAGTIAWALDAIEADRGLSPEAYSLYAMYRERGGTTRDNPDFDRSLRETLLHHHRNLQRTNDGRLIEISLRKALRFRTSEQLLPFIIACAQEKDTTQSSGAFYLYVQLALGSREEELAKRICDVFAAAKAEKESLTFLRMGHLYQRYHLLRAGYNPVLCKPFVNGAALPDSVRAPHLDAPVEFVRSMLVVGEPDFVGMSKQSLGVPGDFARRNLVAYLNAFLGTHLRSLSLDERLKILADGQLFALLLWENQQKEVLPAGKGDDAGFLKPWVEALNRCPDETARWSGLLELARSNRPVCGRSAGTCVILDAMTSVEQVDADIACSVPHRRLMESVRQRLKESHRGLAVDARLPGQSQADASYLFQILRSTHGLVPKEDLIALIDQLSRLPDSGICAKACYGFACMLLGSPKEHHRADLRAFLSQPADPRRQPDDRTHALRVSLYLMATCLERGINFLEVPDIGWWP